MSFEILYTEAQFGLNVCAFKVVFLSRLQKAYY